MHSYDHLDTKQRPISVSEVSTYHSTVLSFLPFFLSSFLPFFLSFLPIDDSLITDDFWNEYHDNNKEEQ